MESLEQKEIEIFMLEVMFVIKLLFFVEVVVFGVGSLFDSEVLCC